MLVAKKVSEETCQHSNISSYGKYRLLPGSLHLSFFVFRQFWRRSYQNQLSFSGKDSTADFFVFRHFDQNTKNEKWEEKLTPFLFNSCANSERIKQMEPILRAKVKIFFKSENFRK